MIRALTFSIAIMPFIDDYFIYWLLFDTASAIIFADCAAADAIYLLFIIALIIFAMITLFLSDLDAD